MLGQEPRFGGMLLNRLYSLWFERQGRTWWKMVVGLQMGSPLHLLALAKPTVAGGGNERL